MSLITYTTPSLLLRSPFNALNWVNDDFEDLFVQPSMEIWPASRLHSSFFNRQMSDMQRQVNQMLNWSDRRLQTLTQENGDQKLKVIGDNENEFKLALNCAQFKPEEVKCKVDGHYLAVEGTQEQKDDKTGNYTKRQFLRRVLLPENAELDKVNCTFKSDGNLAITIPKKPIAIEGAKKDQVIPIQKE